jgi:hypothetical protein
MIHKTKLKEKKKPPILQKHVKTTKKAERAYIWRETQQTPKTHCKNTRKNGKGGARIHMART